MADLTIQITSPVPDAEAGRSISVRGTLSWDGLDVATIAVKVRFGENAEPRAATKIGNSWQNWRCTGNAPGGSAGGGLLTITAIATARTRPPPQDPEPPDDIGDENSVVVRLESTPPVLTIDPYESEVTPPSLPYQVTLSGSAQDGPLFYRNSAW